MTKLVTSPDDTIVYAPYLPRRYESTGSRWKPRESASLVVSIMVHAPYFEDALPPWAFRPGAMQGGVGRDSSEPKHGQVARMSQWDFGLGVGAYRLSEILARHGVPFALATDARAVTRMPGFARAFGGGFSELVVRGEAANMVISPQMSDRQERDYIARSRESVEGAFGVRASGWFSPERANSVRTPVLLRDAGFSWFGDWPVDEIPVALTRAAQGLVAVPFSAETEDKFALYVRGATADVYEDVVMRTIDRLLLDSELVGPRFLGLSWFGWVLGQACFADIAERVAERITTDPRIVVRTPSEVAASC